MTEELGRWSARETAAAVRAGDISAAEVCDAAIARIEARDGPVNAVVVRDFERARAAARALDAHGPRGDPRSLLGVAMTVKEAHNVAGLATTWGLPGHEARPAAADSVGVARLKAAGAVILGKTNNAQALADWQTDNPVFGRTNHPLDPALTPGGSSGGGAAALAAGMVPLEFGSDIGGSIRVPAHLCGVYGHKPSYGVVPPQGHEFPGTEGAPPVLNVVGPMARTAEDLLLAFNVLAGPLEEEPYRLELPPPRAPALRGLRVRILRALDWTPTEGAIAAAVGSLGDALDREGAEVSEGTAGLPDLGAAFEAYAELLNAPMTRFWTWARRPGMSALRYLDLLDVQEAARRRWREAFMRFDVLIAPAFAVAAFPHDALPFAARTISIDGRRNTYGDLLSWPSVATFPGLPATAVPVARNAASLPIGVQVIGPPAGDATTLKVAALLAEAGLTADPRPG